MDLPPHSYLHNNHFKVVRMWAVKYRGPHSSSLHFQNISMKRILFSFLSIVGIFLLLVNFSACSKGSSGATAPITTTSKDSVLINIGTNIIVPSYQSLTISVNSLDSAIIDFNASPNATKLTNLQIIFKNAYVAWQFGSEYNGIGPASTLSPILTGLNLFPTTTSRIDSNIVNGNTSVNAFINASAKGFPALDYLLFGAGSNSNILVSYTTGTNAANRKLYLAAVSADIKAEINAVNTAWSASGGNYLSTYVSGTGTSISGSLGLTINSMVQDFEILKNDCFGIPLGKQPPGTTLPVMPNEVEAYYSGVSIQLALTQLKAVQGIYLGTGAQGNGLGLNSYLVNAKAKYNGGLLSDTIKVRLAQVITDMQALKDPFSVTIQSNTAAANTVYAELQKLVVLFKTDMCSALGILITFGDNDGD